MPYADPSDPRKAEARRRQRSRMSEEQREKDRARCRRYYQANREKALARNRDWHDQNPVRRRWKAIRQRCLNPNAINYPRYGGRGIRLLYATFEEFANDIGPWPGPGYSVDRIDTNGHYAPGNTRWATAKEQRANRRDSN